MNPQLIVLAQVETFKSVVLNPCLKIPIFKNDAFVLSGLHVKIKTRCICALSVLLF